MVFYTNARPNSPTRIFFGPPPPSLPRHFSLIAIFSSPPGLVKGGRAGLPLDLVALLEVPGH